MINAGINDGDVVVIRETNRAMNGDIVVALIEDQEATLKNFVRGEAIALEAAIQLMKHAPFHKKKSRFKVAL